jgi:hypothetical protein
LLVKTQCIACLLKDDTRQVLILSRVERDCKSGRRRQTEG